MNIYSTGVLARVIEALPPPDPFILNSFFKEISIADGEEIHFDLASGNPRLAPFVSPLAPGIQVESPGYHTKTFTPAYIKDKRRFDSTRALKRALGEQIGTNFLPAQRVQMMLVRDLADQRDMLARREEVMAIEALLTGKIIVQGELYPATVVDFERDPSLTKTLPVDRQWGAVDVSPLDDLQHWSFNISKHSAAVASTVVMGTEAWSRFKTDPEVERELDRFHGEARLNPTVTGAGAKFQGRVGDFDIFVYAGSYSGEDGTLTPYLPANAVLLLSQDLAGVRCYGAIRDEEAGFRAMPYFSKTWAEDDPGIRVLLMQSAPLPVPARINASLAATVC